MKEFVTLAANVIIRQLVRGILKNMKTANIMVSLIHVINAFIKEQQRVI